jgi:AraC family carnitine catabolism transcriptional activator
MVLRDVTFLLVPKFSMIALYGALEPLRVANRFAENAFTWRFLSADGQPVVASNGIPVSVSGAWADCGKPDMAVVCASYDHEIGYRRATFALLRKLARLQVFLAGIDTGAFILAEAGVLDGHRATCHWESLAGFRESFPQVTTTEALFELDRDRMTSAGGAAAIDMMLAWIELRMGRKLAMSVADQLVHFRTRDEAGPSRLPAQARFGTRDPRLLAVLAMMEKNFEDPKSIDALAEGAALSVRQLERLFRAELQQRPMSFYRQLRLEHAEHLLNYSHMTVRDVSLAAGFSTLAEFSRAFRTRTGLAPTAFRRRTFPLAKRETA